MKNELVSRIGPLGIPIVRTAEHPCPYFPQRTASEWIAIAPELDSSLYQGLMDLGFRRSASVCYRPDCGDCAACLPIRVPVADFSASRSQRRVVRRNEGVNVTIADPCLDEERLALYRLYQEARHGKGEGGTAAEYEELFVRSPVETVEMSFRLDGALIGIGIVDVCPQCLSSVYFFFHPEFSHLSPGVFSALCEIGECRRRALPYWYIGFWVEGCRKMEYKADFRPRELLRRGLWTAV